LDEGQYRPDLRSNCGCFEAELCCPIGALTQRNEAATGRFQGYASL
jgi:hypothetical protein